MSTLSLTVRAWSRAEPRRWSRRRAPIAFWLVVRGAARGDAPLEAQLLLRSCDQGLLRRWMQWA